MKALVTGCAGFIGSHLIDRLLREDFEVTGIDCFTDYYPKEIKERNIADALKNRNFKFIEENLLCMDRYPEVDYVFHQAAQAGVRASWGKDFEIYTRNNIQVTQRLLEFFKDLKIKKFVYASSSSVYGDTELPMREDSLLKPVSPYGVTKLAAENLCYLYYKNYGVPTVSLRYFTVYGPRQRPDMGINKFIQAILNEEDITLYGDGMQTRDFTFVDDVVEANILAAKSINVGEVFNIGAGNRISVNALIKTMESILEKQAKMNYIEVQKGDVKDTLADVSKAKEKLKWKPRIDIYKGLDKYIQWYLNERKFCFFFKKLKDKNLVLFFSVGVSLKTWHDIGMIDREVALYNELSKYFKHIYFFTYGDKEDLKLKNYLNDNIIIIPKKFAMNSMLYSFLLPFIHRNILKDADILKTNQMLGSWSALFTKFVYKKNVVVRTGYILSLSFFKGHLKKIKRWIAIIIEKITYKFADGIITSSPIGFEYINNNYLPSAIHLMIPNYVITDVFKPLKLKKRKGSICFVGRLSEQKNLFALLESLVKLPCTLTIIGSGEQLKQLQRFAKENEIIVEFLCNIPNKDLPEIINKHEIFILPSLWEGMPKTLLEAMSCGMPVIGTNVKGINEVIEHGKNGILCDTDADSIRKTLLALMEDEKLKEKLGQNARITIIENYSLNKLIKKELELMAELI